MMMASYVEANGSIQYLWGRGRGSSEAQSWFEVDVAWPCQGEIGRWVRAGVLQPLDTSRLEHWGDMLPEVRDPLAEW